MYVVSGRVGVVVAHFLVSVHVHVMYSGYPRLVF